MIYILQTTWHYWLKIGRNSGTDYNLAGEAGRIGPRREYGGNVCRTVELTHSGEIMWNGLALGRADSLTGVGSTFSSGGDAEKDSKERDQTYVAGQRI